MHHLVSGLKRYALAPFGASIVLGPGALIFGFYDQTMIEVGRPYGMALWVTLPLLAAVGLAVRHFLPVDGPGSPPPDWNLKNDRPRVWVVKGVAGSLFVGALCMAFMYFAIGALAESTGSDQPPIVGRVLEVTAVTGGKALCRKRIVLELPRGQVEDVCLVTGVFNRRSLSTFDPVVNEQVMVTLRKGPFGVSVRRISRLYKDVADEASRDRFDCCRSGDATVGTPFD